MTKVNEYIMAYGLHCLRIGAMQALAKRAHAEGKKGEAARFWKAYYDADKEKERCLKQLLTMLGLRTVTGRSPSSMSKRTHSTFNRRTST